MEVRPLVDGVADDALSIRELQDVRDSLKLRLGQTPTEHVRERLSIESKLARTKVLIRAKAMIQEEENRGEGDSLQKVLSSVRVAAKLLSLLRKEHIAVGRWIGLPDDASDEEEDALMDEITLRYSEVDALLIKLEGDEG